MQAVSGVRNRAVACPSCGARRILPGMAYCDLCRARIPERFYDDVASRGAAVEARKSSRPGERRLEPQPVVEAPASIAEAKVEELSTGALIEDQEPETEKTMEPIEPVSTRTLVEERRASERTQAVAPPQAPAEPAIGETKPAPKSIQLSPQAKAAGMPRSSARILGASLVGFGVLIVLASMVIGAVALGGLGLASFLIGLLLVYLPSQSSLVPQLVEASVLSSVVNLERVLREFAPETRAVYLKVHDRLEAPMVLLPLSENPVLTSDLRMKGEDRFLQMDSEDLHKTGLLLEAPGASFLTMMEKESGVDFFDLGAEDLIDTVRLCMVESSEALADLKGAVDADGVKFRMRDGALGGLSRSIARLAPNVSSRLGCPICSAGICAAAKVLKRNMVLDEVGHEPGYHTVTLRYVGGPTAEAD